MSYIVFARKYRPQDFDEIIAQPHITTTLQNAIAQGRVAHAYLFTGPRGIGKTTTARILAKTLNCEKGSNVRPCNSCPSCNEITQGTSLDVLEIDGASNRGIDEIRNLRENVKFAPSKGKFKIYIIDEIHMLTPEAFNALLKTLEEPPPHVKFIFATTQAHKVPPTVLSRCQRFDFRRISTNDILQSLKKIAANEKLNTTDEALTLIAKYADGSMRDAEVVLDQITAFTTAAVTLEDAIKILGLVNDDILFSLSDSIAMKDPVSALKIIDRLVNDGKDVLQVTTSFIEHFRNISVIKISKDLHPLVDISSDKLSRYEAEARRFSIEEILYIIYTLSNAIDFIRRSNLPKVALETAMIKLTTGTAIMPLAEILKKIDALEANLCSKNPEKAPKTALEVEPSTPPDPRSSISEPRTPITDPRSSITDPQFSITDITSSWDKILSQVKAKKIFVSLYLKEGYPLAVNGSVITIGFPKALAFHKDSLDSQEYRQLIEGSIKEMLGIDFRVRLVVDDSVKVRDGVAKVNSADTDAIEEEPADDDGLGGKTSLKKDTDIDPIVKDAIGIFNGDLKEEEKERAV